MLEDAAASVLLTQGQLMERLPECAAQVVKMDEDWPLMIRQSKENPEALAVSDNLAYVIYTSGSTGTPKGVLGLHRGFINRFTWMWNEYPFSADEVCCQKTSLNFLDSVWEIFGPLLQGIRVLIIPGHVVKDPPALIQTLEVEKVTRIVLVPSLLQAVLETESDLQTRLSSLKYCVCSGEALPVELIQRFYKHLPQSRLINLYGSSEVSADVTCYETGPDESAHRILIGRPIANSQVFILDSHLHEVAVGVAGQLYVGGDGLARGYLKRADLTAERFIPNPYSAEGDARLYWTGDTARFLPDGNIEFLGRTDDQVKVRGYRIELGEIEAALKQSASVKEAVVVMREDEPGRKQLVAYVVGKAENETVPAAELRLLAKEKLPEYMAPAVYVTLSKLPLTPSGKVNRRALPAPTGERSGLEEEFIEPQTPVEILIAKIWREVLHVKQVGIQDKFFELGGHSLLATQVVSRIRSAFQVNVPLRSIFEAPTIAELAIVVEEHLLAKIEETTEEEALDLAKRNSYV